MASMSIVDMLEEHGPSAHPDLLAHICLFICPNRYSMYISCSMFLHNLEALGSECSIAFKEADKGITVCGTLVED